jgi:hypothetical protein
MEEMTYEHTIMLVDPLQRLTWILENNIKIKQKEVNYSCSGLCPVGDFGISSIELSSSITKELIICVYIQIIINFIYTFVDIIINTEQFIQTLKKNSSQDWPLLLQYTVYTVIYIWLRDSVKMLLNV